MKLYIKDIEKIKFTCGIILISFSILGGLIIYFEYFENLLSFISHKSETLISLDEPSYTLINENNNGIILGLFGLSGSYLLGSVKK
jgi:hypothetical protein